VFLFVQSLLVPCVFVVFLANLNRRHRFYLLPKEKNFPRRNPLHAEPPLRTSFFPHAAKSSRRTPSLRVLWQVIKRNKEKKEGANGLGHLALRKAVKPLPLPTVVVGKSKKRESYPKKKKEKSRQSKKRKKEKKGSPKGQAPTLTASRPPFCFTFFSFLDNAEPLFCVVRFRTRNQQHLIVFSTIIQLRIIV
jgi:hypothetical protein